VRRDRMDGPVRVLTGGEDLAVAVSEAYQLMEKVTAVKRALCPESLGHLTPAAGRYLSELKSYALGELCGARERSLAKSLYDARNKYSVAMETINALIGVFPEVNPERQL